jgi:hypothetical protein
MFKSHLLTILLKAYCMASDLILTAYQNSSGGVYLASLYRMIYFDLGKEILLVFWISGSRLGQKQVTCQIQFR